MVQDYRIFFLHSSINFQILGNFETSFRCLRTLLYKSFFLLQNYLSEIPVLNSINPDQAQHFIWSDLGPSCLQWSSADAECC